MNKSPLAIILFLILITIILSGCSSSSRYAEKENVSSSSKEIPIRVLISDKNNSLNYYVENPIILYNEEKAIALVKKGNELHFSVNNNGLELNISDKQFYGKYFQLKPNEANQNIYYRGKYYRGFLKIISDENSVKVINRISLEDYLKGVIPAEMPTGKGESYFQALKAFSICARTYAVMKMDESHSLFDVYLDTRDQVYDGADIEKPIANKAVDETKNLILTYNNKPAKVFYSAACGGHTEDASNVFRNVDEPYLKGVVDGDPPNCSIEPGFDWKETYTPKVFINRLMNAGYLSNDNYSLTNVEVKSRFESGRVNQLRVYLTSSTGTNKIVNLQGNNIRSVIRNAGNNGILRSTMFTISINDIGNIIIEGKGNGHGVGLCQWGAINQSIEGKSYKQILSFYFPGTAIEELK